MKLQDLKDKTPESTLYKEAFILRAFVVLSSREDDLKFQHIHPIYSVISMGTCMKM